MRNSPRAEAGGRTSVRLILSYVLDWVIIILIAITGALFTLIKPNHRPFSLVDPSISFPYVAHEKISTATLVVVALIVPAVITALVCLVLVPGPTVSGDTPKGLVWRRKLWEWHTAWMGLALACATSFLVVDGMKNMFGKPRPHLLAVCDPDVDNYEQYVLGGYRDAVSEGLLVSWTICRNTDLSLLNDAFASFPSGHASFSWAGLGYLSLFLCAKFAITIPYLLPARYSSMAFSSVPTNHSYQLRDSSNSQSKDILPSTSSATLTKVLRSQAAAPPTYLLVIAFIPIGAAIYISSTRYSDFMHHGFDIIFGSLIGSLLAWGSFRWYHAPIRRGAGWSWGPRSEGKAFRAGLGVQGYAEENEWKRDDEDVEQGVNSGNRRALQEEGGNNL